MVALLGLKALYMIWTFVGVSVLATSLRILTRVRIKGTAPTYGDYLLLAALAAWIAAETLETLEILHGDLINAAATELQESSLGNIIAMIPQLQHSLMLDYIATMLFVVTLWLIKASLLQWYFDLFPYAHRRLRISLYVAVVWTTSGFIVTFFMFLFWCHPRSDAWNLFNLCHPMTIWNTFGTLTGFDLTSDILIMLLPLSIIRGSQLQSREYRALLLIFGIGIFSMAANIVRLALVIHAPGLVDESPGEFAELLQVCTVVEVVTAFLAACLPALKVLILRDGISALWNSDSRRRRRGLEAAAGRREQREPGRASLSWSERWRGKRRTDTETGSTTELRSLGTNALPEE